MRKSTVTRTVLIAMAVAVVVANLLSQRFASPLRRLTDTSRRIAEGDLSSRVPADDAAWTTRELTELARQFNAMADRLEESVNIIRTDRDRSRDFLADVSHELKTPIAAIRTFNGVTSPSTGPTWPLPFWPPRSRSSSDQSSSRSSRGCGLAASRRAASSRSEISA